MTHDTLMALATALSVQCRANAEDCNAIDKARAALSAAIKQALEDAYQKGLRDASI